jgi:hypothetical protein
VSKLTLNTYKLNHANRFQPGGVWHINLGCQSATHSAGALKSMSDKDINGALLCLDVWGAR